MSIHNSYFSRNNTIVYNSYVNTGRNPVMQLYYGDGGLANPVGYSRFIFDIDLTSLREKIAQGIISTNCLNSEMTHILKMTNTSSFNNELLNTSMPDGSMRATSFDLILFRIPPVNFDPALPQTWDEGVGYDFYDIPEPLGPNRSYSVRPSNWFERTTINDWQQAGIYDNRNQGLVPFSSITIVDIQHFELGNEDIEFDMTSEINDVLSGAIQNPRGWGIAYLPQVENLSGTTGTYSVGFFTRHTQTFYEPYLLTTYNDLIEDDRNNFSMGKSNKLYLYIYEDGNFINLDQNPLVSISDSQGNPIQGLQNLPTCLRTRGVYEVTLPPLIGYQTPCTFTDTWSNIELNGFNLPNQVNEFVLYPFKKSIQIGTNTNDPSQYGFSYYGLKQDERILNTDIRKVGVIIKQAYTTNKQLPNVDGQYRVYVKEGTTEVVVQDWTTLNRTPNEYYFMFDTRDKIPNEYFVDIKVTTSGQINVYKQQINFFIVNVKSE
jgi:hypothetical protein